jgi:phage gp46-like protein
MSGDLLLVHDPEAGYADLSLDDTGRDLARDETLETAILLSLGTDRRARDDDPLPDGSENRRGWWADTFTAEENGYIGSRLWLLHRSKTIDTTLADAEIYAKEALQWFIDEGIAGSIEVSAERVDVSELKLTVVITRPTGDELPLTYFYNWEAQTLRRAA